ncbi:MAG: G/U mismatch-specific DNA glycosylase [Anaerolineales bacterium]|nr:G/U mismatch-specific DNA glycosylase [Anaerolineales bacterium]
MNPPAKPTRADLLAAKNKTVRDVIAPGLRVLFCGINPGLYSAATGHHFARPGNRFWPTLRQAGFTPRLLDPSEERELLTFGYGITNLVARATAAADELSPDELIAGRQRLEAKVKRYQPRVVAVLGISAYRTAFVQKVVTLGQQPELLANAAVWVLPNPSGLNAHYQLANLVEHFQELRKAVE